MNLSKKFYSDRSIGMTFSPKISKSIAQTNYDNTIVGRDLSFMDKLVTVIPYTTFTCIYIDYVFIKKTLMEEFSTNVTVRNISDHDALRTVILFHKIQYDQAIEKNLMVC